MIYGEKTDLERVGAAFRFVALCNKSMGMRFIPTGNGFEVKEAELHPAQEGAFRLACGLLGDYFSGKR
jgi:hypothetical protein